MKPFILFDIDGTLRDEQTGIPESAIKAIEECQKQHIPLCICTGRSPSMIQEDVLALHIDNVIAGGGNYIVHKQQVLRNQSFQIDKIKAVLQVIQLQDVAISIESNYHVYMNQKACDILNEMNLKKMMGLSDKQLQQFLSSEKIQYKDNLNQYDNDPIHKLCLWSDTITFHKIQSIMKDDMVLAQSGKYEQSRYYEIIQKGCKKADAIQYLCEYLNISINETIAFGDGMNDADMLHVCGSGIAMASSDVRLFPYADTICEIPIHDGIYKELKRRNIIKGEYSI